MSARPARGRRWCCCTAMARPATCGCRWRSIWRATTPSSCRTCAAWACRPSRPAASTRRPRRATSPASSTRSKIERVDLVAHDIGNMVGFAFAAQHPQRVRRLVLIDAPLPGVGPWEEILKNPLLWHFRFGGPDMERLVAGRERIYLDRFWNEFSATPSRFSEAAREHYARALRAAGRHAFGLRPVRRVRSGRHRQPGLPGPAASSRCRCWRSAARSRSAR